MDAKRQTAEQLRLIELSENKVRWDLWGPYLAERQWGTVREDYSAHGGAWDYLPHEHARPRAYRWGEDGLLGLFGLTNAAGNHGEDVKELYYHLDATRVLPRRHRSRCGRFPSNGLDRTQRGFAANTCKALSH
jgi:hypothetical protein